MAYVGTPRSYASPHDTLASIIQGEAGNQGLLGMQAVGGVIGNRASSNFNGYGSDVMSQALAHNQFQGQSWPPSANAYSVADSLLAGTNPDPTGGALYYANPGASTATWARNLNSDNSLQIGAHYFTDNTNGDPFTPNFQQNTLPDGGNGVSFDGPTKPYGDGYAGTGWNEGTYGYDPSTSAASPYGFANVDPRGVDATGIDTTATVTNTDPMGPGDAGGSSVLTIPNPNAGPMDLPDTSNGGFGAGAFGGAGAAYEFQQADQPTQAQAAPQDGTTPPATVPLAIRNQTEQLRANQTSADATATANTNATDKTIAATGQGLASALTTAVGTSLATGKNLFTRATVIILGIVVVAAALMMIKGERTATLLNKAHLA